MDNKVYIGPAGWSYPDWNGSVYPKKKPREFDPLGYLASYFNLIEINSTFYRPPAPATCRSWVERVEHNPEFCFSVKAHKDFTHSSDPVDPAAIEAFTRAIEPIREKHKLLAVLLQFPWSFKDTPQARRRLDRLMEEFEPLPLCFEVRHGSWARQSGLSYLRETRVTVCCVDQPVIGDSLTPRTRIDGEAGAYFRLHGRNSREWFKPSTNRDLRYDYLYSRSELTPFVAPIREAAAAAARVAVVMNNHFRGQAVANAVEIKSMLLGAKVRVPPGLIRMYPRLAEVSEDGPADPEPGGWLFGSDISG